MDNHDPTQLETIRTRQELAAAFTALRRRAGLTVRQLAARTDLPPATIGDYMAGRRVPGPAQHPNLRRILSCCGIENELAEEAWLQAVGRVRVATDGRLRR